jgi:hypothetical protein
MKKFVAAVAAPNAVIVSQNFVGLPRRGGRTSVSRRRAAARKRSAPVPAGPKVANTVVASAAAVWSEAQLATM